VITGTAAPGRAPRNDLRQATAIGFSNSNDIPAYAPRCGVEFKGKGMKSEDEEILKLLLCALVVWLLPVAERAADFYVTGGPPGGYTYVDGVLTFLEPGDYTVATIVQTYTNRIVVAGGTPESPVNITLDRVEIIYSGFRDTPIEVRESSCAYLILKNGTESTLYGGDYCPAIRCADGATLIIGGEGTLKATGGGFEEKSGEITILGGVIEAKGGTNGAGIGGGYFGDGGKITISGGVITAEAGDLGSGIGGGYCGSCDEIVIEGGMVTATGDGGNAGIGGDMAKKGCSITISGGTVTATGGAEGSWNMGIGAHDASVVISGGTVIATGGNFGVGVGGFKGLQACSVTISGGTVIATGGSGGVGVGGNGASVAISGGSVKATGGVDVEGALTNGSGAPVHLTTLTLSDVNTAIPESGIAFGGMAAGYGKTGLRTDADGRLYFYLPAGNSSATYTSDFYIATIASGRTNEFVPEPGSAFVVNYNLTNLSPNHSTFHVAGGGAFDVTLVSAGGYKPPETVEVTMGGVPLAASYTYDGLTGALHIDPVTGDIVITASGIARTYDISASPANLDFGKRTAGYSAATAAQTVTISNNGNSDVTGYTVTCGGTDFNVTYTSQAIPAGGTSTFTVQPATGLAAGTYSAILLIQTAEGGTTAVNASFTVDEPSINYFTISATAGEGGSISPGGSVQVEEGGGKTYTITADKGYEIAEVLVDGVNVGAVSSYTFKNVWERHTIAASFRIVNPFNDVAPTDWFYDNVLYVCRLGLMSVDTPDIFRPHAGMTRAEAAAVLFRLSGDKGSYTPAFIDVDAGSLYGNAVAWAAANNILLGTGNGRFDPGDGVTREQFAVMLYRYARYKGHDVLAAWDIDVNSYSDAADISNYALDALRWALGAEIVRGDGNRNLNPRAEASRAEVSAMLQRFIERFA
jgi:hypothetical protein